MTIWKKFSSPIHHQIYFWSLALVAISLTTSKALMSIAPFLALINWVWEGNLKQKMQLLKKRPSVYLLMSVFVVYLLGILWTDNYEWGIVDIKIQIPILILPLVIGTSQRLTYNETKRLFQIFSGALIVASFCSMYVWLGFSGKRIENTREISLFISHIRYALLINIGIFSLGWFALNPRLETSIKEKWIYIIVIVWLIFFLFILKSVTGLVVFFMVSSSLLIYFTICLKNILSRILLLVCLALVVFTPIVYMARVYQQFYDIEIVTKEMLNQKTKLGNTYSNHLQNKQLENGHYVFLFVSDDELREAWNKRSPIDYDSVSASGYNKYVLLRYLTSKGLKKDAEGLEQLTNEDIKNIEHGIPNYLFANRLSVFKRAYQIIWELDQYKRGGDPSGHSFTQRIEYYKMGWQIIQENFWFGHGTGGYFNAYQKKYDESPFFKNEIFRQRSHNMFLSYWVDFGLIGLLYILFALAYPIFLERKQKSYLVLIFVFILLISFLNEDTIANHDGIVFFSFLYSLYLFSDSDKTGYLVPGKPQNNE